jgi:hypothetical protein
LSNCDECPHFVSCRSLLLSEKNVMLEAFSKQKKHPRPDVPGNAHASVDCSKPSG